MDTPESLQAAIRLEPGNADYHALLAEHEEGKGANPQPQLLEAISLSPLTSRYLTRAALRAELDQDYPKAATLLIRAAKVDRKFAPRWAVLNFYFRRGNATGVWPEGFWQAINDALEIGAQEDATAVFRLAWARTQDAAEIQRHLSGDAKIQRWYLSFLLDSNRLTAAGVVAKSLAAAATERDLPLLLYYGERVVRDDTSSAVEVWNQLVDKRLIAGIKLNPEGGSILTNKNFILVTPARGFDWRIPNIDGVSVTQALDGHGLRVHFSGDQPEDSELIGQIVPVLTGRRFGISYHYSATDALRGIFWEVTGARGALAQSPELSAAGEGTQGQVTFTADASWARVSLRYRRPLGSVRAEGTIVIREISDQILR